MATRCDVPKSHGDVPGAGPLSADCLSSHALRVRVVSELASRWSRTWSECTAAASRRVAKDPRAAVVPFRRGRAGYPVAPLAP
jgi:hypothetical protein